MHTTRGKSRLREHRQQRLLLTRRPKKSRMCHTITRHRTTAQHSKALTILFPHHAAFDLYRCNGIAQQRSRERREIRASQALLAVYVSCQPTGVAKERGRPHTATCTLQHLFEGPACCATRSSNAFRKERRRQRVVPRAIRVDERPNPNCSERPCIQKESDEAFFPKRWTKEGTPEK